MLVPRSIAVSLLLLVLAVGCSSSSATNGELAGAGQSMCVQSAKQVHSTQTTLIVCCRMQSAAGPGLHAGRRDMLPRGTQHTTYVCLQQHVSSLCLQVLDMSAGIFMFPDFLTAGENLSSAIKQQWHGCCCVRQTKTAADSAHHPTNTLLLLLLGVAEECDHLVAVSETRFSRSSVVSTEADGKGEYARSRTAVSRLQHRVNKHSGMQLLYIHAAAALQHDR